MRSVQGRQVDLPAETEEQWVWGHSLTVVAHSRITVFYLVFRVVQIGKAASLEETEELGVGIFPILVFGMPGRRAALRAKKGRVCASEVLGNVMIGAIVLVGLFLLLHCSRCRKL